MKQKTIKGKTVNIGELRDGKIYKEIIFTKHFFFKGQSLGIDKALIDQNKFKFNEIVLKDKQSKHTFRVSDYKFWENAYKYKQPNFQEQYMLKKQFWTEYDENGKLVEKKS